jgi:hypothetical protein
MGLQDWKNGKLRRVVWAAVILVAVVVAVVALAFYGYTGLDVEPGTESILTVHRNPDWKLGSGEPLIEGVTVDTTADIRNTTFVPLYLPEMEHALYIGDEYIGDAERTPSMWLGPWAKNPMPVSGYVPREALPAVIVALIESGGNIDVTVKSTATVAGVTVTQTEVVTFSIANPQVSVESA